MTLKSVVRKLAPPIVLDAYRAVRPAPAPRHTWEGVYRSRREVPASGEGFDGRAWAAMARQAAESLHARLTDAGTIPRDAAYDRALLGVLGALVCRERGRVRVLDFGGGLGLDYLHLVASLGAACAVDYHIVETPEICREAGGLYPGDAAVRFHTALPADLAEVDVATINTALQYVDDWAALLRALCAYRPRYVLLVRLAAGDNPTFASAQVNMRGMSIPHWFLDVREVIRLVRAEGYALIFKSASEQHLPQDNFPLEYRVGRACNLLFVREVA